MWTSTRGARVQGGPLNADHEEAFIPPFFRWRSGRLPTDRPHKRKAGDWPEPSPYRFLRMQSARELPYGHTVRHLVCRQPVRHPTIEKALSERLINDPI